MPVSKKRKKPKSNKRKLGIVSTNTNCINAYSKAVDIAINYANLEIIEKNEIVENKLKEWGTLSINKEQLLSAFTNDSEDTYKRIITVIASHIALDIEDGLSNIEENSFEKLPLYTSIIHTFYDVEEITDISKVNEKLKTSRKIYINQKSIV